MADFLLNPAPCPETKFAPGIDGSNLHFHGYEKHLPFDFVWPLLDRTDFERRLQEGKPAVEFGEQSAFGRKPANYNRGNFAVFG